MGSLWNRSGLVERQDDDIRASGALAYFYEGGTTTAFTVYQDAAEGSAHTNPVEADANGRWPDVFVPYTIGYDVRVTTADGVQISYTQNIPNPDPVDLSVTIPAENQVTTGMIHAEFVAGTKSGYVRCNGRSIGNAVSGATERANADTSALFVYLWNNVSILGVSGGRGGSGASDFAANKTIDLPDLRASVPGGLDDMGNTSSGAFSGLSFNAGDGSTPDSFIGGNARTLATANIPAHSHTGTTSTDPGHTHTGTTGTENSSLAHTHTGSINISSNTGTESQDHSHTYRRSNEDNRAVNVTGANSVANSGAFDSTTGSDSVTHTHPFTVSGSITVDSGGPSNHTHSFTTATGGSHSHTFTTSTVGSSTAFNNMPATKLVTWFIKL